MTIFYDKYYRGVNMFTTVKITYKKKIAFRKIRKDITQVTNHEQWYLYVFILKTIINL